MPQRSTEIAPCFHSVCASQACFRLVCLSLLSLCGSVLPALSSDDLDAAGHLDEDQLLGLGLDLGPRRFRAGYTVPSGTRSLAGHYTGGFDLLLQSRFPVDPLSSTAPVIFYGGVHLRLGAHDHTLLSTTDAAAGVSLGARWRALRWCWFSVLAGPELGIAAVHLPAASIGKASDETWGLSTLGLRASLDLNLRLGRSGFLVVGSGWTGFWASDQINDPATTPATPTTFSLVQTGVLAYAGFAWRF